MPAPRQAGSLRSQRAWPGNHGGQGGGQPQGVAPTILIPLPLAKRRKAYRNGFRLVAHNLRRLRTLFFALVMGIALWSSPGAAVDSDGPLPPGQDSFSLVDEAGNSTTDLRLDPHIDPPQVGLDPTALVTAHNVLGLVFQQSAATRQLWFIFAGVGLGLLIFSVVLVRLAARTRTVTILLAAWALAFSLFAGLHWTVLDTVQHQRLLLTQMVHHAADQASAPDFLVPLAATLHPLPRALLAALHLGLDLLVLGTMLLLWRHARPDSP